MNINRDKESLDQILFDLCIFNRHCQQAFRARIRPFPFAGFGTTSIELAALYRGKGCLTQLYPRSGSITNYKDLLH